MLSKVIPSSDAPEIKPVTREEANLFVLRDFVNLNFVSQFQTPQFSGFRDNGSKWALKQRNRHANV
ncbi:hypothetical protein D1AOALGA4SA_9246 [Olavius algarvensis Delta 1 endosymbiont]|nr:hypothetical protein D1AOALGA4SA_9246 [Olavius algarvensis Delta 1 endosymbiont]